MKNAPEVQYPVARNEKLGWDGMKHPMAGNEKCTRGAVKYPVAKNKKMGWMV